MKTLLAYLLAGLLLAPCILQAQSPETTVASGDEVSVLYRRENAWGIMAHTQGFGLNYRIGLHKTAAIKRVFEFEFTTMRHPKEVKSINPYFENAKSFKYGKLNYAGLLRVNYGRHKTLNNKPFMGGIEVRYLYKLGVNAAFLKPVYLSVLYPTNIPYKYTVADEQYDPDKHRSDLIYGRASFFKGFDKLKVQPGLTAKFGFSFEYGTQDDILRSLDLGVALDAYLKNVPLMAYENNKNYFLTLFVSLHFGQRDYY